ncbi:hypothetical protein V6N13_057739 [Hibiscus sabdariffa]
MYTFITCEDEMRSGISLRKVLQLIIAKHVVNHFSYIWTMRLRHDLKDLRWTSFLKLHCCLLLQKKKKVTIEISGHVPFVLWMRSLYLAC